MGASWRIYKSPPGWRTTETDRPWTVMQRIYAVYSEYGKRDWVIHSTHTSWMEAINTVIDTQLETLNETKEKSQ